MGGSVKLDAFEVVLELVGLGSVLDVDALEDEVDDTDLISELVFLVELKTGVLNFKEDVFEEDVAFGEVLLVTKDDELLLLVEAEELELLRTEDDLEIAVFVDDDGVELKGGNRSDVDEDDGDSRQLVGDISPVSVFVT